MKHIKLFEEFKSEVYALKKKIPIKDLRYTPAGIKFKGVEQYITLANYFKSLKFNTGYFLDDEFQKMLTRIDKSPNAVFWYNPKEKKAWWNPISDEKLDLSKDEIEDFEEYFKYAHEFRGHNLKRFGV